MDDRTVSATRVYRDCVLNVLGERFRVDLVPIPLCGLKVIVGMDYLGANGATIDCEFQLVRVRTPSGGELYIHGERASQGPTLCSASRAKSFLQQGCMDFWNIYCIQELRPRGIWKVYRLYRSFRISFPRSYPECLRRGKWSFALIWCRVPLC